MNPTERLVFYYIYQEEVRYSKFDENCDPALYRFDKYTACKSVYGYQGIL